MTNPAQNATFAARQQEREDQMHAAATPAVGDRIFVKEYESLKYFVPPNGVLVNPIRQTTGGYHSTVVQVLAEEIGEDELGKPVYSVSIIDATGREHPVEHVQLLYGK